MRGGIGLLYLFVIVFAIGVALGYFVERSGIIYTQAEISNLRIELENMQLQEMFVSGTDVDCNLLFSTMGKLSYDLYSLVNGLQQENPNTPEFRDAKIQADFLSLRAWILARNIKESCTQHLLPILFLYSSNCTECQQQDSMLQEVKGNHDNVLVYSIDFESEQPALKLVRDAYSIESTPSMIIDNTVYDSLDREQLEAIVCEMVECAD